MSLLILRNGHVAYHYYFKAPVMLLRPHGAMSILVVQTHTTPNKRVKGSSDHGQRLDKCRTGA